ncbi:MAG TPA: hypothetical protein VFZ16_16960 [Hyphomicrobiaceae bacterium]|nr:hypothetical protein [Hyphomicrobiaceae bacterium]
MKALVVYYSLTGRARALAQALAQELGADSGEIRCARYHPGFWVYVKGSYDSAAGHLPAIDGPAGSPSDYDLVVLTGPIWASHAAPPLRAYLRAQVRGFSNVAFALTHRGSPPDKALRELQMLAGVVPTATLVVRESDIETGAFKRAVAAFADALRSQASGGKPPRSSALG